MHCDWYMAQTIRKQVKKGLKHKTKTQKAEISALTLAVVVSAVAVVGRDFSTERGVCAIVVLWPAAAAIGIVVCLTVRDEGLHGDILLDCGDDDDGGDGFLLAPIFMRCSCCCCAG